MTVRASQLKRLLAARLREDRELLRVQGSKATLARSGMSVTAENEVTVDGDLIVDGQLNVTGATTIGGNAAITGTLSLPAGIINNDALANPLVPAVAHADAQNFSVGTTWGVKCTATIPVPAGFTQALILSLSTMATAQNSTGSVDYLYCSAYVPAYGGGLPGWTMGSTDTPAGNYAVTTDFRAVLLRGLSGSFTISGQVSSAYGTWAASNSNLMNLDASILFLR